MKYIVKYKLISNKCWLNWLCPSNCLSKCGQVCYQNNMDCIWN